MHIFNKVFGKNKKTENIQNNNSEFISYKKTDYKTFEELLEQNAGLSFEKQMIFTDVIGENAWNLDTEKGSISFGELEFPVQIIGSLAFDSNSWMWGWANTQSGIPENLLIQSNELKKIGGNKNIEELINGHFNVDEGFEYKIGMLSCGIFNSNSYYCTNYGQGILVVTIDDDRIPKIDQNRTEKILTNFPQLISGVIINHKNTFLNYLIDRDFKLKISENKIEGLRNSNTLIAEFDELDRLKSLNGKSQK